MGNEMGNNNTSAIKEEDNISEAEKKTNLEDTSDLANGISPYAHADSGKEENQNIPTTIANNAMEKASKDSNDITNELGKDTKQEDGHTDDVKGKTQLVTTTEAKDEDAQEKAILFGSNHIISMLENGSVEEDTHASDVNMENQKCSIVEAEGVQENDIGLASEDKTTELGKVTLQEDSHEDGVEEKIQMIPTTEARDVQEKATGLISNNTASILENGSLGGDTYESDKNMEDQMHPTVETENVQEKAIEMASDYPRSSPGNDSFEGDAHEDDVNVDHQRHQAAEGKDDQIEARLDFGDKTSEFEDKQAGNVVIPIADGTDVHGKTTISASEDPLNLSNAFEGAGDEITEVREPEKSQNAESVEAEGKISESLSSSSLEGTEEYEKQEEPCLGKHISVTYNHHHLNNEPSIKQDEEETTVLTLNAVNMSNDSELQESSNVHSNYDEPVKFLSEKSFLGTESLLEENLLDTNSNFQQTKDDVLEKEMEFHEKLLSTDKSDGEDGDEFGSSLMGTSGTKSDSPSIGNNTIGNSLTMVNSTTEDSLNSLLESLIVDNPLKFDHQENCKVLYEESKLSRDISTTENSHDYKLDECVKGSLKEHKSGMVNTYEMAIESNGDCMGERTIALDSSVFGVANIAQVEQPKVTENGLQFDTYLNKASYERSATSEPKHSVVSEAETGFHIAGLTVVDCIHEEGGTYKNKIEGTNEKPEASHVMVNTFEGTEMSEQCNFDLVTIYQEESFSLQNSSSLLHINDYHQDNVKQTKSFSATSMPNSDWKHTNESKNFGTNIDNLDSLTVPSVDLVDDETFEKEGENYSQHTEAASSAEAELTTSAATMSIEPCSNSSTFANGGYETRDSLARFSTESNTDNPNISCQIQKSPSFNLNLRREARPEESDQTPLLHQDKFASKSLENHIGYNLINSMPHAEYNQCMLPSEEMPVEEKIVTMERSYSKKSKAPFIGLLKEEEEEAHLLVMPQTQHNHIGTAKIVKEVSSTSAKEKEKRKPRSFFFSSCMCCATVAN
ncbi:hypothetical protein VNO77_16536 [Canavalia gladiata]|uniref:Uncharacterized protein n=1 Tax=Canavalia gladiata TaxID=3824 RepID=A0AAN9QQ03_CANGL